MPEVRSALRSSTPAIIAGLLFFSLAFALHSSAEPRILTQIPVPGFSFIGGVAVNPKTNLVFATLPSRNEIVVIDGNTNSIIGTVPVGESPLGVAVNPNTNRIYVANQNSRDLSVIDGETNTVVATLSMTVEHQGSTFTFPPFEVDVNPATNRIYVTRAGGGFPFAIIDGATNTVVGTFVANAFDVAVNPVTNRIYATEFLGSQRIGVFEGETNTRLSSIFVGDAPLWIAVNPSTNRIYTANEQTSNASVIDGATDTLMATIDVPDFPFNIAVNPITNRVYVASGSGAFTILDGSDNSVVAQFPLGQTKGIGVNTVTSRIYVAVTSSGHIAVIEDNPVIIGPEFPIVLAPLSQVLAGAAYEGSSQRYLVAIAHDSTQIQAQLLASDGTQLGSPFSVSIQQFFRAHARTVAADSRSQRFLVAWERINPFLAFSQVVNADGSLLGSTLQVFVPEGLWSGVAFSPTHQVYLYVWRAGDPQRVLGQLLDASGSPIGSNLVLAESTCGLSEVSVAFDPGSAQFLVTWWECFQPLRSESRARFVSPTGQIGAATFSLPRASNGVALCSSLEPVPMVDSTRGRFLVIWRECFSTEPLSPLYGVFLGSDGLVQGSPFQISDTSITSAGSGLTANLNAVFDAAADAYLVVWTTGATGEVSGQLIAGDGAFKGSNFSIGGTARFGPAAIAHDAANHRVLVAYVRREPFPAHDEVVGRFVEFVVNQLPVANAGGNQSVGASGSGTATVTLNGSGSSDPNGDALSFDWKDANDNVVGTSALLSLTLPCGIHTFTLTVTDALGATSTSTVVVTVQDTTPPTLTLSTSNITAVVPTASATGAAVNLSGIASASDACDPSVTITNNAPALFPIGLTSVTFTATDDSGNSTQAQLTVQVVYNFIGFLLPIRNDGSSIFKLGRTIPIKFQLTAADGTAATNATATLQVFKVTDDVLGTVEEITPEASGGSNTDNFFRFSDGNYIYNLNSTGYTTGTYILRVCPNDQTTHDVQVSIR